MTRSVFNHRRASTSGVLLASDTFNRTNGALAGTNTDGNGTLDPLTWAATRGTFNISSNTAVVNTLSGGLAVASVDLSTADVDIRCTRPIIGNAQDGIAFRISNSNNYWLFACNTSGSHPTIIKVVANATNTVYTGSGVVANGDVFQVVAVGSSITVYRNGTSLTTVSDSFNSTATKHGIGTGIVNGASFDDWKAYTP